MEMMAARRFPFAAVGLVLIGVFVAPSVIGMVRTFAQLGRGEDVPATSSGELLSFHPAFMACGLIGVLLVIAGILRAIVGTFRAIRPTH